MLKLFRTSQFLLILFVFICSFSFSQTNEQKKDTTQTTKEKLESSLGKSKLGQFINRLIVKTKKKPKTKSIAIRKQNFSTFENKIIRKIVVKNHDPFGFSFIDSTKTANTWIEKTGNAIHTKSKEFAIKNYLLFKRNKPLDSLKLIESERLIRSEKFIRSVEITVKTIAQSPDSVDVYVNTLDSWSIVPGGAISSSDAKLQVTQQNFLGFGHEFRVAGKKRFKDDKVANGLYYSIPNFKNTYIRSELIYNNDFDESYSKIFNIGRTFFSPFTKWAARIYIDEQFKKEILPDQNKVLNTQNIKYNSQDIWAGYSFNLFKGNTERTRTANIITAVRWLNINYKEKPALEYDIINFFSDETFYLGSIGFSSRQFVKDRNIFRDGIIENVPVGDILSFTGGKQYKNGQNRFYFGTKIAHGNYYNWGYLSASFEYGTFFNESKKEQITYAFNLNYFTNLILLSDKWKMRQFVTSQLVIGKNRLNTIGDRLTIDDANYYQRFYSNDEQEKNNLIIPGFEGGLLGTSKYVLALQTQFYPNWEIIGFRFNPFINITGAMIGNEDKYFLTNKLYSSFSLGLILRNDYLVFNSIRLSLSYYPNIPRQGNNIFGFNSINTEDFGLQGFELQKPAPISYN